METILSNTALAIGIIIGLGFLEFGIGFGILGGKIVETIEKNHETKKDTVHSIMTFLSLPQYSYLHFVSCYYSLIYL